MQTFMAADIHYIWRAPIWKQPILDKASMIMALSFWELRRWGLLGFRYNRDNIHILK